MSAQSDPDLLYSDVENDLRASVRDLLDGRCEPNSVLERTESAHPYDLDLWRTFAAESGMAGLQVPETLGGQGASARETAVVLEELGRTVAPIPFLGTAVLATSTLLGADVAEESTANLLKRLSSGRTIGTLAVSLTDFPRGNFPDSVRATATDHLTGRIGSVADASVADVLLVPATGPEGDGVYEVEATAAGVDITEIVSLDMTRRIANVTLTEVNAHRLVSGEAARSALEHASTAGAALLASEQLGLAQQCLDQTVRYVKERYQFGRPVGSFQGLKHRLADLYLELVTARAAARYAADSLAKDHEDTPVSAALAQSYCSSAAVHAAEECVQLHGGIGMTWEHSAHLYLKRAKSNELALGTPGSHRAKLGVLVDLPG